MSFKLSIEVSNTYRLNAMQHIRNLSLRFVMNESVLHLKCAPSNSKCETEFSKVNVELDSTNQKVQEHTSFKFATS